MKSEELRVTRLRPPSLTPPFAARRWLAISGDAVVASGTAALSLVWWGLAHDGLTWPGFGARVLWIPVLAGMWMASTALTGAYAFLNLDRMARPWGTLGVTGALFMSVYLAAYFFAPRTLLPRMVVLVFAVLTTAAAGLWRMSWAWLSRHAAFRRAVMIAGAGEAGRLIARLYLERPVSGSFVVGFVDDDPFVGAEAVELTDAKGNVARIPVLGTSGDIPGLVERLGVAEVVVAVRGPTEPELLKGLLHCHETGLAVRSAIEVHEELTGRLPVDQVGQNWSMILPPRRPGAAALYPALKRVMDMVGALAGLAPFCVALPLLAVAIKLDSPGPVFYKQVRVGRGGRSFWIWKLRTMRADAEATVEALWVLPGDPRTTRLGRWLRRTRLDELPQLWNVLKGDMSLVGPRPAPELSEKALLEKIPFYRLRYAVRPGVAGWAAVHHEYVDSVPKAQLRLEYDLFYIKHCSLWLDLHILSRALGHIVALRGR